MSDAVDLVTAAVADAGLAGEESATPDALSTPTAEPTTPAAPATPDATSTPEPVDEVEAELAEQGLKPPVEGQRENRIPYTRVQKIVANARKKLTDAHEAALKTEREKLTSLETRSQQYDALLKLAATSPRGLIEILAKQNPAYAEFLRERQSATALATTPATGDPEPQPDVQFEDGSKGYSPKQHAALMDWHARQAADRATAAVKAEYDKRFGPIERDWQARRAHEAVLPKVAAQRRNMEETWGADLIKEHEKEIVAALKARPEVPAEAVVAGVLLPKVRQSETQMRAKLLKELNQRPAAAQRSAPAAAAVATPTGPRTAEEIVAEAMASLR